MKKLCTSLKSIIPSALIVLFFTLMNNTTAYCQFRKSPNQIRQELRQSEGANPFSYISVSDYNWSVNLVSNTVIKGNLRNSASISGFKNVKLKATFYTKTGSYVAHEIFTVLEFIPPGGSIDFRRTIEGYWKDAKRMSIEILSAESY